MNGSPLFFFLSSYYYSFVEIINFLCDTWHDHHHYFLFWCFFIWLYYILLLLLWKTVIVCNNAIIPSLLFKHSHLYTFPLPLKENIMTSSYGLYKHNIYNGTTHTRIDMYGYVHCRYTIFLYIGRFGKLDDKDASTSSISWWDDYVRRENDSIFKVHYRYRPIVYVFLKGIKGLITFKCWYHVYGMMIILYPLLYFLYKWCCK